MDSAISVANKRHSRCSKKGVFAPACDSHGAYLVDMRLARKDVRRHIYSSTPVTVERHRVFSS